MLDYINSFRNLCGAPQGNCSEALPIPARHERAVLSLIKTFNLEFQGVGLALKEGRSKPLVYYTEDSQFFIVAVGVNETKRGPWAET